MVHLQGRVLTRSRGACPEAPGMPELFLGLTEVCAGKIAQECAADDCSVRCSFNSQSLSCFFISLIFTAEGIFPEQFNALDISLRVPVLGCLDNWQSFGRCWEPP